MAEQCSRRAGPGPGGGTGDGPAGRGALQLVRACAVLVLVGVVAFPAAAQQGDVARGEVVFQRCAACHTVKAAEEGPPGPNLHGVAGRKAASLPAYEYSDALAEGGKAGLVWTDAELDRYLTDAEARVPGTSMTAPGLSDPADRKAVIAYLKAHGGGDQAGPRQSQIRDP